MGAAQQQAQTRDADAAELEAEVLRLRAAAGDAAELGALRRELGEQVAHARKLEMANREQLAELRALRTKDRAVAVVEEEKRGLEIKIRRVDELERELGEARIQREILADERRAWVAYLQDHTGEDGEGEVFDSPEAVARALMRERAEKASLAERMGALQPEIVEKDGIIQTLETECTKLRSELEKAKAGGTATAAGGADGRAKARLERQKALAVKEVEYLREQLRTFDAEDVTGELRADADERTRARIASLEDLVAQYRAELQTLQTTLSALEASSQSQPPSIPTDPTAASGTSLKRPLPSPTDDADSQTTARLATLSRRNQTLRSDLAAATKEATVQRAELAAMQAQLAALQAASRTRILALRNNPTDEFQAARGASVKALREENADLRAQLEGCEGPWSVGSGSGKTVPASYFAAANAELGEVKAVLADREKSVLRLKQVWSAKSLEFREAVASLLGWKMEFLPNGRFRLTSLFYPPDDDEEGEGGNSLVFNGDTGMMKISGGPDSAFGREIRPLIRFWVEERKEIPGFMAACTLEFYERTTRAQRM